MQIEKNAQRAYWWTFGKNRARAGITIDTHETPQQAIARLKSAVPTCDIHASLIRGHIIVHRLARAREAAQIRIAREAVD